MWRACSSRQQRWHGCDSKQCACVRQQAAAAGGTIAMDGRQPACVRQRAADGVCIQQHAAVAACVRQRAAAAVCVRQRAGADGSTIAMGDSDGCDQPVAQLRWAAAAAAQRTGDGGKIAMDNGNGDGQLWFKAGVGGCIG
jgi:hypothetical protein